MASKLRRTPLFGYDGNLGIPVQPPPKTAPNGAAATPNNKYNYQTHLNGHSSTMNAGITPAQRHYSEQHSNGSGSNSSPAANSAPSAAGRRKHSNNGAVNGAPATPNKHVNFGSGQGEEKKREKFLTAKYGAHQMALIRKRLRVEMWMYERLQELYGAEDIEIDLDEVLDMDSEIERRQYINNLLRATQAKTDTVNIFVGDLLEKVKTL